MKNDTRGRQRSEPAGYQFYEELIEGIPSDICVLEAVLGISHVAVRAESGTGVAMSLDMQSRPSILSNSLEGIPSRKLHLRDLAAAVLSWNFRDASLGVAALNAWYNSDGTAVISFPGQYPVQQSFSSSADPFLRYKEFAAGKKVASIGHFVSLERTLASICDLSVIEQTPHIGDYPEAAAEYLLMDSDIVFITGCTFANKTLPRLLELCTGAFIVLAGPSVTLATTLFEKGVSVLAGSIFSNSAECLAIAAGGEHKKMVKSGMKVLFEAMEQHKG